MQVANVTRSQWTTGPGSSPNSPEAVVNASGVGRYLPAPERPGQARVLLVARTHASGLRTAQAVVRQWAAGVPANVRLLGLVADASGKRPKPLKEPAAPHFRRRAPRLGTPVGWRPCASVTPGPGQVAVRLSTAGSRP